MRALEFLVEGITNDVLDELSNIASVLLSKGEQSMPTAVAIDLLNSSGYNVDIEGLISIADQSNFITTASEDELVFGNDVDAAEMDANQADVDELASQPDTGADVTSDLAVTSAMDGVMK